MNSKGAARSIIGRLVGWFAHWLVKVMHKSVKCF